MIGTEITLPIISIITYMITISVLIYLFNNKIGRSRTVRIIENGKICSPTTGELPSIILEDCDDNSSSAKCYQPDPTIDLVFEVGTYPVFYQTICSRLCEEISVNGACINETSAYASCISFLKPPDGCNSTANPLGRLNGSNQIYYANSIII
jgi:hypothetical protein